MQTDERFAAKILDVSTNAVASSAASALLESEIAETASLVGGFGAWRSFYSQATTDLVAAMRVSDPSVFGAAVRWQSIAFRAREAPIEILGTALGELSRAAAEALPADSHDLLSAYMQVAQTIVDRTVNDEVSRIDGATSEGRLALQYIQVAMTGDRRGAIDIIERAADDGTPIADLYMSVLLPAMVEVGAMWHLREVSIAEEHVVSDTTRGAMAMLSRRSPRIENGKRAVVIGAVQGNAHDIGVRAAADFFEMAGWRAVSLGADVPAPDFLRAVAFYQADLVGLSVTTTSQLEAARTAINLLREQSVETKILVGGGAFAVAPDLWQKIGADQVALSLREAPDVAQALVA